MSERYRLETRSKSGHCCFEFSVMDAQNPDQAVAECFGLEEALRVTAALNLHCRLGAAQTLSVVAPLEPTEAMVKAGDDAGWWAGGQDGGAEAKLVWAAMINASGVGA